MLFVLLNKALNQECGGFLAYTLILQIKNIKLPILIVRSSLDVIEKKWSEKIKKNAINSKQCEFYEIKSDGGESPKIPV